ncbi:MAG TPA: exopolysaccharide biosynthesis polyprenyl glycosylphosphotransferase [Vicinamibacterales bacterium]
MAPGPFDLFALATSALAVPVTEHGGGLAIRVCWGGAEPPARKPRTQRAIVLGLTPLFEQLVEAAEADPSRAYEIVGLVDDTVSPSSRYLGYPILGPLSRLTEITERVKPDRIIVALKERREQLPIRELLEHRIRWGMRIEDGLDVYERLTGRLPVEGLAPSEIIFSHHFHQRRLHAALGRLLSVLVALIGLIVAGPLLALLALAIKLDSPGPVFFTQPRVGVAGRPFTLIKFRTMAPAAAHTSEWVVDNRDRITRLGRWLRRLRLDELPQLVNILRGDMNLVGPRPHPVTNLPLLRVVARNLNERTGLDIPYYSLRSMVRPGLTGWAQIRYGYANNLDEEMEKLRYDLYYIKHMSLALDCRILLDTFRVMVSGRGSQGVTHQASVPMAFGAAVPSRFGTRRPA